MAKTDRDAAPAETEPGVWKKRLILGGVGIVAGLLAWWIGGAVIPRWWAQRIGGAVDGRLTFGTVLGLAVGFVCTFVPVVILRLGWKFRDGFGRAVAFIVAAVLVASPNLATLGIVRGNGNAAHAGERILDVDGPGFRGGTLVGAVVALIAVGGLSFLLRSRRKNKERSGQLERELAHTRAAQADS